MKGALTMWISLTIDWQCTSKPYGSYAYSTILHIEKISIPINSCSLERYVILIYGFDT
jgi:hypothetical protein